MERIKRSFRTAFHKIKHSFKEFLPFFLALFLIQCIFFSVILSFRSNVDGLTKKTESEYSYHVLITGLYEDEMLILKENRRAVFLNEFYYTPLSIKKYSAPDADPTYDMTVELLTDNKDYGIFGLFIRDTLKTNYEGMLYKYGDILSDSDHVSVYLSPLYNLESSVASLHTTRNLLVLAVFLFSFVVLYFLYKLYVNKQTFSFGVFSAFGANSKRLRENAFTQLYLVGGMTLLPAYYASGLICYLVYKSGGAPFHFPVFSLKILLSLLIIMLPLLLLVVRTPIKLLSKKPTAELLQAADARDLILSPNFSAKTIRSGFPLGYEALSFWRFRKHHFVTAAVSAFLCILLILGMTVAGAYQTNKDIKNKTLFDFSVRFRGVETITDQKYQEVALANGIKNAYREYPEALLTKYDSLLFIDDALITRNVGFGNDASKDISYTGDARLIAAGMDTLDYYSSIYRTNGDLSSLLDGPNRVVIGSTYRNKAAFDFSIGDTVRVAVPVLDEKGEIVYKDGRAPTTKETGEGLWTEMYERISYEYITLEIVGIIEDYPSASGGIPMLVSTDVYQAITGVKPTAQTIAISVDNSSAENYAIAFDELSRICTLLGNATVSVSGASFEAEAEAEYCYTQFIPTLSFMLFLFLPLIWFYSQNALTERREQEYKILYSLSVPPKKMRLLCLCSSLMLLPVSLFVLLSSLLTDGLLSLFINDMLPNVFHISLAIVGHTALPLWVYAVILLALFICFLLSFFIPYYYYTGIRRQFNAKP